MVRSSHGGLDFDTEDLSGPGILDDPGMVVLTPERLDLEWRRATAGEGVSVAVLSQDVVDAAEEPVHHLSALLQDRAELLPVHGLGDMAAGMAGKRCDLLDRHAIIGQQRDERVPQVPRRPVPANPGPLANVL